VVERDDLRLDPVQQQRASHKEARLKDVIEEALAPGADRRYTLRALKAIQLAIPVYRQLVALGSGWEQASAHMRLCLLLEAACSTEQDRRN
jgi:hypothetical protein